MPKKTRVQVLSSGVAELCKGAEVAGFVSTETAKIANKANAAAIARRESIPLSWRKHIFTHGEKVSPGSFVAPPYAAKTKIGRGTAFGVVSAATKEGGYDNNQNHTLYRLITS